MKYIVDIDDFEPLFKVDSIGVFGIGKSVSDSDNDHSWSRIKSIEEFEELNSDYINEHFGSLQDDAYQRGFDDAHRISEEEYHRGLEDGKAQAERGCEGCRFEGTEISLRPCLSPCSACCNAYHNQWTAKDDKIEVGDEVEWDNDFTGDRFIVTRIYQPYGKKEQCDGIDDDGDVYRAVLIESLVKTGRHFDIASILKEMQS